MDTKCLIGKRLILKWEGGSKVSAPIKEAVESHSGYVRIYFGVREVEATIILPYKKALQMVHAQVEHFPRNGYFVRRAGL